MAHSPISLAFEYLCINGLGDSIVQKRRHQRSFSGVDSSDMITMRKGSRTIKMLSNESARSRRDTACPVRVDADNRQ